MLYCFNCEHVYDKSNIQPIFYNGEENYRCPNPACKCELTEIDELIFPIIKILNDKGYHTDFCCSGHSWDDYDKAYIKFYSFFDNNEVKEDKLNEIYGVLYDNNLDDVKYFEDLSEEQIQSILDKDENLSRDDLKIYFEDIDNYNDNLLKYLKIKDALKSISKYWYFDLKFNSNYYTATLMIRDFPNWCPDYDKLIEEYGEEFFLPHADSDSAEFERLKVLYEQWVKYKNIDLLYYNNDIELAVKLNIGIVSYNVSGYYFCGSDFSDLEFIEKVYGKYCWDGNIVIRNNVYYNAYLMAKENKKNLAVVFKYTQFYKKENCKNLNLKYGQFFGNNYRIYDDLDDGVVYNAWLKCLSELMNACVELDWLETM